MNGAARDEFGLIPGLIMLNHASYGLASRQVLAAAERIRNEIESDPTRYLGTELTERLRGQTTALAAFLGLDPAQTTLTTNATAGAAAVIDSVPLHAGDTVVAFDTEYSSILRAWELACERAGARLIRVPVRLPFDGPGQLIAQLEASVPGAVSYLQMSLVSSSSAIHFPVKEVAAWTRLRGGRLVLDAAHGPGHVPVDPAAWGVDAMFGTVHKWFPALRPIGILWLAEDLVPAVRPAEVSLTWDSDDLIERFSWPGTFDPIPRLSLQVALDQWQTWNQQGTWAQRQELADTATQMMSTVGARPTTSLRFAPPRLRAFTLDAVTVAELKAQMRQAGIRAWVGPGAGGECILRIATHIYNDVTDIEATCTELEKVLNR